MTNNFSIDAKSWHQFSVAEWQSDDGSALSGLRKFTVYQIVFGGTYALCFIAFFHSRGGLVLPRFVGVAAAPGGGPDTIPHLRPM